MTSFNDREKGFEAKYKLDEEMSFRITVRRNRLLGLWAAEKLGIPAGSAADEYAKTVVDADFQVPGDEDVVEKVRLDLVAKGIGITEAEVRAELGRAAVHARELLAGS